MSGWLGRMVGDDGDGPFLGTGMVVVLVAYVGWDCYHNRGCRRGREAGRMAMTLLMFALNTWAALLMGTAIGVERQWRQHTAGLRTNALVAVGAAAFVGLSMLIDREASPTRIAAQVVSGLGFLGGGVILRDGLNVRGLNTAATIWCSGAVGALAGAGYSLEALIVTASVLAAHLGLRPLARWIDARIKLATDVETLYRLRVESAADHDAHIRHILLRHVNGHPKLTLHGLSTEDTADKRTVVLADIFAVERADRAMEEIVARVSIEPEVKAVSWQQTVA